MTELAKPAKSFFFKCDLDLTLIYEVIQRGTQIFQRDCICGIHLARHCENFIKIGRPTPEILQIFLWGVFLPPLVLYVWRKPCTYEC